MAVSESPACSNRGTAIVVEGLCKTYSDGICNRDGDLPTCCMLLLLEPFIARHYKFAAICYDGEQADQWHWVRIGWCVEQYDDNAAAHS